MCCDQAFGKRVGAARSSELDASAAIVKLRALLAAVFSSTPTLVAVTMLGTHVARGRPLSLPSAMAVLSAVNLLRSPLLFLPLVLQSAQEAQASLGRMQALLPMGSSHSALRTRHRAQLYTRSLLTVARGV